MRIDEIDPKHKEFTEEINEWAPLLALGGAAARVLPMLGRAAVGGGKAVARGAGAVAKGAGRVAKGAGRVAKNVGGAVGGAMSGGGTTTTTTTTSGGGFGGFRGAGGVPKTIGKKPSPVDFAGNNMQYGKHSHPDIDKDADAASYKAPKFTRGEKFQLPSVDAKNKMAMTDYEVTGATGQEVEVRIPKDQVKPGGPTAYKFKKRDLDSHFKKIAPK